MDKIWWQSKCPSTGKWKNKIWYVYNGVLFSNTKEGTTDTSYTMDEPQKHAKGKKPVTDNNILYVTIYLKYVEKASL